MSESAAKWIIDPFGTFQWNENGPLNFTSGNLYHNNDDSSSTPAATTATDSNDDAKAKAQAATKKRISDTTETIKTTPLGQYGGSGSVTTQKKTVLGI